MDFDKVINKMKKKGQKLWSFHDISAFFEEDKPAKDGSGIQSTKYKIYKVVHRLISMNILVSIRKGLYLWNVGEKLDPEDFYWPIVKKVISENYLGQGIIISEKALAFGLRDYSLPETLSIAVPKENSKLLLFGSYKLSTLVIRGKKSLFPLIKKYSTKVKIDSTEFMVTCPEHALLESLTTRTGTDKNDTHLIERWLAKNGGLLREAVFGDFITHKYISAANRLKYLSKDLEMNVLYSMMVRIIDNQGKGCHLSRDFLFGKYPKSVK